MEEPDLSPVLELQDRKQNDLSLEKYFSLSTIPSEMQSSEENTGNEVKIDHSELKLALKKIKNDSPEATGSKKILRSYEEMKKEMKELEQNIKTEYEVVKDLMSEFFNAKEDLVKTNILLDLEFYVHQYDNALDFVNMNGFTKMVLPALNSTESGLRSAAAFLMGIQIHVIHVICW